MVMRNWLVFRIFFQPMGSFIADRLTANLLKKREIVLIEKAIDKQTVKNQFRLIVCCGNANWESGRHHLSSGSYSG